MKQQALTLGLPVTQPDKIKANDEFPAEAGARSNQVLLSSSATAASFRSG